MTDFNTLANEWWNLTGPLKTLHQINPVRLSYIKRFTDLKNKSVLDIGCGGGILAETLTKHGAIVTGIDLAEQVIHVAKDHAKINQLKINYQCMDVQELANQLPHHFDIITCMELLEHVDTPEQFINACAKLIKPNGELFLSTINRTPKAFALAIVAAEYVMNLVPKNTHEYDHFIKPSELAEWLRNNQFSLENIFGIHYDPLKQDAYLTETVDVNYLVYAKSSMA